MTTMQPDKLMIYRADASDLDALVPLFDGYRVFYQQPSNLDASRGFLETRLTQNDSVIFLADMDGPVGFTQLFPSFSSPVMKRLWLLNDLFVTPGARRSGVAKALLERARQHALETQAKGLLLRTGVDNTGAQGVYEAAGWERDQAFYTYLLNI